MSFKQTAITGVKWTSMASISVATIKLIQFAILAHYLSPGDFGLMAIVMTIIGFSALFIDFGISAAIIHKQTISEKQLSSLYWLNVLVSICLFVIVFGAAPIVSWFYKEPKLTGMVRLLAVTFIISGLGNQFTVLLQKELKFKELSLIHAFGAVLSFVIALLFAMNGFGVYSLVWAAIVDALVVAVLSWILGLKFHRPKLVLHFGEIKSMISFGLFQMGERSVNYLNGQFDILLIGKIFGTEILGIYSIAKNISMKPYQIINPIINKVTFPILSKVQDDEPRLRSIYLRTINFLCSVNFPIYILVILLADGIILTFFGENWSDAIVILQILAAYRMFTSFGNPIGSLQLARGRADLGFYWNLGLFLFVPLVIFFGSQWGIWGVASSLLGLQLLIFSPAWYFLVRPLSGASYYLYMKQIVIPFLIAFVGGGLVFLLFDVLAFQSFFVRVIVASGVMVIVSYLLNQRFNRDFFEVFFDFHWPIDFIKARVPRSLMGRYRRYKLKKKNAPFKGEAVECSICHSTFSVFASTGLVPRANAICRQCGSAERHRLIWKYMTEELMLFDDQRIRILHFAPEKMFYDVFSGMKNVEYVPCDLFPKGYDFRNGPMVSKVDITDILFPEETFDFILATHVLEHIPDDKLAMSELFRVMKSGGCGIFQVPVDYSRAKTYEDFSIVSPKGREKAFGQDDHVRWYGRDYKNRLEKVGFRVIEDDYVKQFSKDDQFRFGFMESEMIYYCEK